MPNRKLGARSSFAPLQQRKKRVISSTFASRIHIHGHSRCRFYRQDRRLQLIKSGPSAKKSRFESAAFPLHLKPAAPPSTRGSIRPRSSFSGFPSPDRNNCAKRSGHHRMGCPLPLTCEIARMLAGYPERSLRRSDIDRRERFISIGASTRSAVRSSFQRAGIGGGVITASPSISEARFRMRLQRRAKEEARSIGRRVLVL